MLTHLLPRFLAVVGLCKSRAKYYDENEKETYVYSIDELKKFKYSPMQIFFISSRILKNTKK